jgi:hypothetical protein
MATGNRTLTFTSPRDRVAAPYMEQPDIVYFDAHRGRSIVLHQPGKPAYEKNVMVLSPRSASPPTG